MKVVRDDIQSISRMVELNEQKVEALVFIKSGLIEL